VDMLLSFPPSFFLDRQGDVSSFFFPQIRQDELFFFPPFPFVFFFFPLQSMYPRVIPFCPPPLFPLRTMSLPSCRSLDSSPASLPRLFFFSSFLCPPPSRKGTRYVPQPSPTGLSPLSFFSPRLLTEIRGSIGRADHLSRAPLPHFFFFPRISHATRSSLFFLAPTAARAG